MTNRKRTKYSIIGLVSFSLIIAAVTYGFTAINAAPGARILGDGYELSEFQVSKICYTLNEENPTEFTAVEFQLDQDSQGIAAGVSATKSGEIIWAEECSFDGRLWTCTFGESHHVLDAEFLHVASLD
jgi:hypothetical protein